MAGKGITIYTPPSSAAHIYAEDDAQVHRALIGGSGITFADNLLACTIINNNTIRMASGVYSVQGYLICIPGGTSENLIVESGAAGAYRHDLVIAEFIRGGGETADAFSFRVLKGASANSADTAVDPQLVQGDLTNGDTQRQEALYRLIISGETLTSVERIANFIGNVYQ